MFQMLFYIGLAFTLFFGSVSVVLYKKNRVGELLYGVFLIDGKKREKFLEEPGLFVVEEDIVMVHTKEQIK